MVYLKDQEIYDIISTLQDITQEMIEADYEKCPSKCKFAYMIHPTSVKNDSKRYLIHTDKYIRVFYRKIYLGIASKSDPRFNKKGQYIGE